MAVSLRLNSIALARSSSFFSSAAATALGPASARLISIALASSNSSMSFPLGPLGDAEASAPLSSDQSPSFLPI